MQYQPKLKHLRSSMQSLILNISNTLYIFKVNRKSFWKEKKEKRTVVIGSR